MPSELKLKMTDGFKRGDIVEYIGRGSNPNPDEPARGSIGAVVKISPHGDLIVNWISHGGTDASKVDGCGWPAKNFKKICEANGVQ